MHPGITIIEEVSGIGMDAQLGDVIEFSCAMYLNNGDLIEPRFTRTIEIGKRHVPTGVENALIGMRAGGYRKVRVGANPVGSSHDGGERTAQGALSIYELWLARVIRKGQQII